MTEPVLAGLLVVPRERPGRSTMFHALWDGRPGVVIKGEDQQGIVLVRWCSRSGGPFQGGEPAHALLVVDDALELAWALTP